MGKGLPLISLVIISYNQEKYIQEAVESAFAQDYCNLEIIISDDHSQDDTWGLITRSAKRYSGDHQIILNRNQHNLGIVLNLQKAVSLSSGEWIVCQAGDDVSLRHRVSSIQSKISETKGVFAIGTACRIVDSQGKSIGFRGYKLGHLPNIRSTILIGATAAYHRDCFTLFPSLNATQISEDLILPFRALLLGKVVITNIVVLLYRVHEKNVSSDSRSYEEILKKWAYFENRNPDAYMQRIRDINAASHIPLCTRSNLVQLQRTFIDEAAEAKKRIEKLIRFYELKGLFRLRYILKLELNISFFHSFVFKCKFVLRQSNLIWRLYSKMRFNVLQFNCYTAPDSASNVIKLEDYKIFT